MTDAGDEAPSVRDQIVRNQEVIDGLNAQLARKTDEVRIIQQISSQLTSTLDLETILDVTLTAMDTVLGFRHGMILLAGESDEVLRVAASRGYDNAGIGAEVPFGHGVFGVVAKRRRIMRMGNIQSQRAYLASVRKQMEAAGKGGELGRQVELPGIDGVQSQIGIPLVIKDRLVGVFGVESAAANAFDELDELLLSIVANQIANAIDNARLHLAEVERLKELDHANAELSRLNETLEASVEARTAELTTALADVQRQKELSEDLLERMAPPAVIPLMLDDKLVARRLEVSVLFTDLEGFTAYSSGMEPDEIFSQLNHYFSRTGEIIQRYRGYVNKTNGDSVMALFGVPFESPTHRTDAVLAGLVIQDELQGEFPFNVRVGINSGTVAAGMLGPANKSLYDVLGDAVNVASRMEGICPVGGVAVTSDMRALLASHFRFDALGELDVKGKGVLDCFNVAGIRSLSQDTRRVDPSSRLAARYIETIGEIETFKREVLGMVDFVSIQARDVALNHNEAVAFFALALLRDLRSGGADELADVDERDIVAAALLHDLGKHAIAPDRLNAPSLGGQERDRLRRDLLDNTKAVLRQVEMSSLGSLLDAFYRFEGTRGAGGEFEPAVEILAAADIYDALTAPKVYKGAPWRIVGALEELMRLPYCLEGERPVFKAFVELMKPENATIGSQRKTTVVLR
jgi:adenylate cyclase